MARLDPASCMAKVDVVEKVASALRTLGIQVERQDIPDPRAFVPGVWLDRGVLYYSPALAQPGDMFHEAGHMAVVPSRFRPLIRPGSIFEDDCPVAAAVEEYLDSPEAQALAPDHWMSRACLNSGEQETIAWSYAAALEVGFPTREVFEFRYPGLPRAKQPYQGEGKSVHVALVAGCAPGIHGLQHSGMCRIKPYPASSCPLWPKMIRWVQD